MAVLTAAVVIVGLLCLLDLLLTFGVIRRLREHAELLSRPAAGQPDLIAGAGTAVGGFGATTVDGEPVTLVGRTLVGFFSPGCGPCAEQLPRFVETARDFPGGRDAVLAVVVGGVDESAPVAATLTPAARVAVAAPGDEIEKAFRVRGYPAFCVVDEAGFVVAGGQLSAVTPVPAGR